jgi:hypothetical protein
VSQPLRLSLLAAAALWSFGVACDAPADDDDVSFTPSPGDDDDATTAPEPAVFRVVHAAPALDFVDVWLRDYPQPLVSDLEFFQGSPPVTVDAGPQVLELRAHDDGPGDPPLASLDLGVVDGGEWTVVIARAEELQLLRFEDGWTTTATGEARLRLVHAGADARTFTVDLGDDGGDELLGLAPGTDSGPEGLLVPADAPLPLVLRDGTTGERLTRLTLPALDSDERRWAVVVGTLDALPREEHGLAAVLAGDAPGPGRIRQDPWVTVFWAGAGDPVDVHAGALELLAEPPPGATAAPLQVPPDGLALAAHAPGPGPAPVGPPLVEAATGVRPGELYLAVATGTVGDDLRFELLEESFPRASGDPRVRLLHAAPAAGPLDFGPLQADEVARIDALSGLVWTLPTPSLGQPMSAGPQAMGAAEADTTAPVARWSGFELDADALDLMVLWDGPAGLQLQRFGTRTWPWTSTTEPAD